MKEQIAPTAQTRSSWEESADVYLRESARIEFYREVTAELCRLIDRPVQRLLDFGCGDGRFTRHFLERLPSSRHPEKIYLLDSSETMLARTRGMSTSASICRLLDDDSFRRFPIEDRGTVDVIACNCSMQNLRDQRLQPVLESFLKRAARLLAPTGIIVANMPDQDFDFAETHSSQFHFQANSLWPETELRKRAPQWNRNVITASAQNAGCRLELFDKAFSVNWEDFVGFYRIPAMGLHRFPHNYHQRLEMLERQAPTFATIAYRWAFMRFSI